MHPECGVLSLRRTKTAHDLAALYGEPEAIHTPPTLRLIEEALIDQSTHQHATRTVTSDQLHQALSLHLTDTTCDAILAVLLSGYFLGHDHPFENLCQHLLKLAHPLCQRQPPPAFSHVVWLNSFFGNVKNHHGSSMERAHAYLKLLQQEIALQSTKDNPSCRIFYEWSALCRQLLPHLPDNAVEIATKAFAGWFMTGVHSPDEIAAVYSFLGGFFLPYEMYDTLKNLLAHIALEKHELGLLLTILWSKQPVDSMSGSMILQTFDKLITQLETASKLDLFKKHLIIFYRHISQIPVTRNRDCPNFRSQTILEMATRIATRLGGGN